MTAYLNQIKDILPDDLFSTFYALQFAAVKRSHTTFTLVFIHVPDDLEEPWEDHLQNVIRDTDIAFRFPTPHPYIALLPNVKEPAAIVFLTRILKGWEENGYDPTRIKASILNISSNDADIHEVVKVGRQALLGVQETDDVRYVINESFATREVSLIKVSIIEEDPIVTRVLSNLLYSTVIDGMNVDLRGFQDGLEFLESDWYQSPHAHIIVINDVLPRKTGFEVLQQLRNMPGEQKFHIFMMTRKQSEEEMIYAYEQGVDEYIIKPFNLKLFEAKIKTLLGRLYL